MKTFLQSIVLIFLTLQLSAQAPQKMSYQAVIRNANNTLVSIRPVGMRISIIQGSQSGALVYSEIQAAITNLNGLVSLQIGTGSVVYGKFTLIDWAKGPYFIKTETDPEGGTNYAIAGTSELLSVPYALFALNKNANEYSGISDDLINLANLTVGTDITLRITSGLAFATSENIVLSNSIANHFHGTVVNYNKITGTLTLYLTEIVGNETFHNWTISLDGAIGLQGIQGIQGLPGIQGERGLTGLDGLIGITGAKGDTGQQGKNGVDGKDGIAGVNGAAGQTGLTGAAGSFTGTFNGDISGDQNATVVEKINGISLASLSTGILKNSFLSGIPSIAVPEDFPILNQNTKGTATNVTGIVLPVNGGTGIANNNAATLSLPGSFPLSIQTTGITSIVLPTEGTLYGTAVSSVTSSQLLNSLTDATGTNNAVFSQSPALTGLPTAPTAIAGANTTQLATTAFVLANSGTYQSVTEGAEISSESTYDVIASGMTLTPTAGKYLVTFNSQYTITPGNRTGIAKTDLKTAYNLLMAKTVSIATHPSGYGSGETLYAGVYATAGPCTASGVIILDAQNNPNAEFIFRFSGSFTTAAGTSVSLINGASACNVYWVAETTTSIGASGNLKGNFISNTGSVTISSNTVLEGRVFANVGAITLIASTIIIPVNCVTIFGTVTGFAIFTSMGNILNMGSSNITGDIGTNSGTISGFGSSTVTGTIYPPSVVPASTTAIFSIYQNGSLIPFSQRSRISTLNLSEISLQGIATVAEGEAIDIRWKIDAGTVRMQNRILTIAAIR